MDIQNSEVYTFLMGIARKLRRPEDEIRQFAKKLIEENWLDTLESLKELNDDDWKALSLPLRLVQTIKQELSEHTISDKPYISSPSKRPMPSPEEPTLQEIQTGHSESTTDSPDQTTSQSPTNTAQCEYFENEDSSFPYSLHNISDQFNFEISQATVEIINTLLKIIDNILSTPTDPKKRLLKKSNKLIQKNVCAHEIAKNTLLACGFIESSDCFDMPVAYISRLTDFHHFLANKLAAHGLPKPPLPNTGSFNPYSSQFNFTSMDSRKVHKWISKIDQGDRLAVLDAIEGRKSFLESGGEVDAVALDPKIFPQSLLKAHQAHTHPPFPFQDDADPPLSMSELSALREILTDGPQFQSRAKKELQSLNKQRVYSSCTIRVLFPDKMILQLNFKPSTTFRDVKKAIENYLLPEFKAMDWYIYETPPVKKFNLTHTLYHENLVPTGLIHFAIKGQEKKVYKSYLKPLK